MSTAILRREPQTGMLVGGQASGVFASDEVGNGRRFCEVRGHGTKLGIHKRIRHTVDEIPHHFETMRNHCLLVFAGES